jgi:hypothetical protein
MPDSIEGRVTKVSGGEITLELPSGATAEIGERFSIVNNFGRQITQVKVIRSDATEIVARQFQSFISNDVRNAVDASFHSSFGTALVGAALGGIPGAVIGAALGNVLGKRQRASISPGMKVIPALEIERQDRGWPSAEA